MATIDVIVNFFLPIMILVWIFFNFYFKNNKGNVARHKFFTIILWIIFIILLIFFIKYYSLLKELHDIDDAIEGAVKGFLEGKNPYKEEIVPRFAGFVNGQPIMKNSTFNYPPTSLLTYSLSYILLHPIINEFWYPITNIIFGMTVFLIFCITFPEIKKQDAFPIFASLSMLFIFDNIMLSLLFVSIAFYFIINKKHFPALLFLFIGATVKFAGLIMLSVFFLYILQKFREIKCLLTFIIIALAISLIMVIPFGIYNVVYSTIFYFSDISIRSQSSIYGGTLLVYLMGNSPYFAIVSNACILLLIISSLFIENLYSRLFLPESLLPLFTIQASRSLLLLPFYSLLVFIIKKIIDEKKERQ